MLNWALNRQFKVPGKFSAWSCGHWRCWKNNVYDTEEQLSSESPGQEEQRGPDNLVYRQLSKWGQDTSAPQHIAPSFPDGAQQVDRPDGSQDQSGLHSGSLHLLSDEKDEVETIRKMSGCGALRSNHHQLTFLTLSICTALFTACAVGGCGALDKNSDTGEGVSNLVCRHNS